MKTFACHLPLLRLACVLAVSLAISVQAGPTNGVPTNGVPTNTPADASTSATFNLAAYEHDRIMAKAGEALVQDPVTITKYRGPYSEGGPNDFYSMGDSWFPDPTATNGLPYKQRQGQMNPDNFNDHKKCLWQMRESVTALAAAYKITGNNRYAAVAAEWLRVFFIDPATRMNPNLTYAQAVPGVYKGRTMGVSDALALVEIPKAVEVLQKSPSFSPEILAGMKDWSKDYLAWLTTNVGEEAADLSNNHMLIYWLQVATFGEFVNDQDQVADSRTRYKLFLVPGQINADGSFSKMIKVKSYSTSVAQLDDLTTLCQALSSPEEDLWHYKSPNERTIRMAVDYMYPFIDDKNRWPKIEASEEGWPGRRVSFLFAGLAYHEPRYIELWKRLPAEPANDEVRRYTVVTQPILWVNDDHP